MGDYISHRSWMGDLPDETPLTALNIPGTHNSCSIDGPLGLAKTQNLDLADQLDAGIRFLDIRLAHYQDNLFAHHNAVYMGKSYADILEICRSFLSSNPTEALLLSIKEEDRVDSALRRFAPSEGFGKYRGDPANWVIRSHCFADAFKARTWQHLEDPSLFYNFPAPRRGGVVAPCPGLTARTTLGDVRGKIVLFRRFEASDEVGFDFTDWPENRHFRTDTTVTCSVEDCWRDPGEDNKFECVVSHLEQARRGNFADLYITFASAVSMKADRYSGMINQWLNIYLAGLYQERVGIIVMDYFEQPRNLVTNVIKLNKRIPDRRSTAHVQPADDARDGFQSASAGLTVWGRRLRR